LLAKYRRDPVNFSTQYDRRAINRKIDPNIERNIVKELKIEKVLIKYKFVKIGAILEVHNYNTKNLIL